MLAGTWPMEDVQVTGSFHFDMALVLPTALVRHFKLCPHNGCLSEVIDLASFYKLTTLHTLTMYSGDSNHSYHPENCFLLSTTLTNLIGMILPSWLLLLLDGCSVAECLANLVHASTCQIA